MTETNLKVSQISTHIVEVSLGRPPENYIDPDILEELADRLLALCVDRTCRVVILSSVGKHFCAGANLRSRDPNDDTPRTRLYRQALRLFEVEIPIIAAIQGAAIGGGLGLALAADFRIACPEARFSANFARIGYHHGFALTVTLPAAVGFQRSAEMLYTGKRIDGARAFEIGLCDYLVDQKDLRNRAVELATEIAGAGPLAVRAIRATVRRDLLKSIPAALGLESMAQSALQRSQDFAEGVAAASERREPVFRGQ